MSFKQPIYTFVCRYWVKIIIKQVLLPYQNDKNCLKV